MLAPDYDSLDPDPFYENPANVGVMLADGSAFALFEALGDGVYDAHLICDEDCRGAKALDFGRAAVAYVFTTLGAACMVAHIPLENRSSRRVCRAIGGIPVADTVDVTGRRCKKYVLERDKWDQSSAA